MGNQQHKLIKMPTSILNHFTLLLLCIHSLILCPQSVTGQQGGGVPLSLSNFQALQSFRHELIDPRGVLKSWNDSRNGICSRWAGIRCVKGQVIAIHLPFKSLGGRISSKIGMLKELRRLSLHDNLIEGTIPSSLGSLPNLRALYLFNNRLSGSIPPSLGNFSQLQSIDLSNNFLSGFVPPSLVSSSRIYRVNLSLNSLSGLIPPSFAHSSSLTFLALNHNNFSGPIPDSWGGRESNGSYQLRALTLDYNSLVGTIPHSLGELGNLEVLSLSHNKINGTIPNEIIGLSGLRVLDLSSNDLNGSLPKGLDRLKNLSSLNLKLNHFSGPIPPTIGNLSSITLLDLSQNNFSGPIPASLDNLSNLKSFNVSYNKLSGQVPSHLSKKFNASSFVGNLQLCGFNSSSSPCPSSQTPTAQSPSSSFLPKKHHHRKRTTKDILLIVMGSLLAILLLLCCVLVYCLIRKRAVSSARNGKSPIGEMAAVGSKDEGGPDGGKLVMFDGSFGFTTDDLLSATAETMGKSPYGTMYKATLEDGNQVVVKRLREKLAKRDKEFEKETVALGRIRHPNILPLRAYYLGPKGEKLLVFDCLSKGTLSSFLHARAPEAIIDWPTRMKITTGIARGLNHLHTQENLIHGNLTSTDIYLDEQNNPKITNYGLSRLMTDSAELIPTSSSIGYRSPELSTTKEPTTKTDIYSLGVIMLELLTGKPASEGTEGSDLPQWVASMVKDERTNEVFDLELMRDVSSTGDEMLNTLKLALHLVDPSPEARPEVEQVVQQLEDINPRLAAEGTTESSA